jgi:serine/threonine-protein kinase
MEGIGDLDGHVLGGRYRLGEKLGQGGMGAVYAAMQTSLGRRVAIKVLLPLLSKDASLVARFRGEAERAARLNHPNIVNVYDFGQESDGSVWIAMELLEGEALADRMERGPMSEAEVVSMAKSTLAGLEAAHAVPLVHRDLKPDNIFIAKAAGVGEVVKILDFGIAKLLDGNAAAKLTATGLIIGTPLYMSPEQARGDDLDHRSDLYSLGAVLYEALTGQPPFTGPNYNALLVAVLMQTPRHIHELRPDLHPTLADVVMRALDKEAARRFESAREMSAALSSFTPSSDKPPSPAELGLASTMATPPLGSVEPAKQNAATPVSGGVGPAATRQGDVGSAEASVETAPMTGAPAAKPPTAPRRHGWLVGAMVVTALFAGVGGTYAYLQSGGGDAEGAALSGIEVQPISPVAPPAVVVAPIGGATNPMVPATGAPNGMDTEEPGEGSDGEGEGDAPSSDTSNDSASSMMSGASTGMTGMRRGPTVAIRASGGIFAQHRRRDEFGYRDHANWSSCWPPGMPFPLMNRGISIIADSTPEGELSNFRPAGNDTYPVISACVMQLMRGMTLGPAENGQGSEVRISFSFYELSSRR